MRYLILISSLAFLGLATLLQSQPEIQETPKSNMALDPKALAKKLVIDCAHIGEGDLVVVRGGAGDAELLEDCAVEIRKAGGHSLLTLFTSRLIRGLVDDTPDKWDTQKPEMALKLAGILDAQIIFESFDLDKALSGVDAGRRAAFNRNEQLIQSRLLERNVKQITVGNGIYPLPARAKRFGVTEADLAKVFWSGVNADYDTLHKTGEKVRERLVAGKKLRLTHPNGTDLTVAVEKRPVFVSDGIFSPEKVKKGGAACQVWLPAGEVFLTPVAGSANGKVILPRVFFEDHEVINLVLRFKDGKLESLEAESGGDGLRDALKAGGPGKDLFGYLDIGINSNVELIPNSKMLAYMAAGMVTVGVGNNLWAGGDNKSSFDLPGHLPGATLTIDDTVLVEKGKLVSK